MPISSLEASFANQLTPTRAIEFKHSRGYVRQSLADLWQINALEVPLKAPPGEAPELNEGFGFISFSHCHDALLIGWSTEKIGVDLERVDRAFQAQKVAQRYFSKEETQSISHLKGEALRTKVLDQWLIKEAAIKWQRSSIGKDLSNWHCQSNTQLIVHKLLGYELGVHQLQYDKWRMAVVSAANPATYRPMLCLG